MATYEITTDIDVEDVLDCVSYSEEEGVLLEILERFNSKNVNAALREYVRSRKEEVTGVLSCVDFFEEEKVLLEALEKFDINNVNNALREFFRFQRREKLPDFVDADKL